jgi:hypothetical protein
MDFIYLQSELKFSFRDVCDVKRDLLHSRTVEDSLHVGCTPYTENSIPSGSKDYIYDEALLPFWFTHTSFLLQEITASKEICRGLSNCEPVPSLLTINPGEISI